MRRQGGFTLLEAIVAMVLISGAGGALLAWISSELESARRLQESGVRAEATVNAVEFMRTVNPMTVPEGNVELAPYRLEWNATLASEIRPGLAYPLGVGLYQLALYDTRVRMLDAQSKPVVEFNLQQVGFKKVRGNSPY